jgi:hypothetical protein
VMKKAGLMVATTAGLMLAASPLAFAGTGHDGGHGDGGHGSHGGDHGNGGHGDGGHGDNGHGDGGHGTPQRTVQAQNGLVNVQDVADLNANACNANVLSNVLGLLGNQIAGASGSCETTDAGGDGVQLQNGLVNVQDLADLKPERVQRQRPEQRGRRSRVPGGRREGSLRGHRPVIGHSRRNARRSPRTTRRAARISLFHPIGYPEIGVIRPLRAPRWSGSGSPPRVAGSRCG